MARDIDTQRLSWQAYFMELLNLYSGSSCNRLHVGCVLVKIIE